MAHIQKLTLEVKSPDFDFNSGKPPAYLGLQEFSLTGTADFQFIERLMRLCESVLDV